MKFLFAEDEVELSRAVCAVLGSRLRRRRGAQEGARREL